MGVPQRLRDLDTRRTWARLGAPAWFLFGIAVVALCNASLVVLALAALVRLQSWWSGTVWKDSGVWHWLPGGVVAMVAVAFALSAAYLVIHGISAAPGRVVQATGASPSSADGFRQVHHVAEELSIGLGVPPPELFATDDAAPNALSAHGFRRRVIVHTAGVAALPRSEIEAMLAHEMGHLHAADARWVTAASVSLGSAKRYVGWLLLLAGGALVVFFGGLQADLFLVSWLIGAILLGAVAAMTSRLLGAAKHQVRSDADDVADVVAVRLAKHPEALGELLRRLEHDRSTVARSTWRTAMLWFEEMPEDADDVDDRARIDELRRRRAAAYATANLLPPPDPVP